MPKSLMFVLSNNRGKMYQTKVNATQDRGSTIWMERLHTILNDHLSEADLDNQKIAALLDISERQFYRKVKKLTRQPPNQYIRNYRLQAAKTYLESGIYFTVKEVSFAVGYMNVDYFRKQFLQTFSKTPLKVLQENGWR